VAEAERLAVGRGEQDGAFADLEKREHDGFGAGGRVKAGDQRWSCSRRLRESGRIVHVDNVGRLVLPVKEGG
jgi:hypothetical protein